MDFDKLQTLMTVIGPVLLAVLSSYITWRVKTSSEDRRGFQALIDANDKFREAMFREVERKEQLIQKIASENEQLIKENRKLQKQLTK